MVIADCLDNLNIVKINLDSNAVKIYLEVSLRLVYRPEMLGKRKESGGKIKGVARASYHHGDLRDTLIKAARTMLEAPGGLEALSLRAVARAAGVSQAAPYHHFADKQALLDAVAAEGFDALTLAMESRMASETNPVARLDASGLGYVAFAVENPALFRLMFANVELTNDSQLNESRKNAYHILENAVASAAPASPSVSLICLNLWALVHGLAKLILEAGVMPADYGVASPEALAALLFRNRLPEPPATKV